MEKLAYFAGILLKNLGQISPEYEKKAHFVKIFWAMKERNWFCAVLRNVFNETKRQFWKMMSINLCNNNNNRNINFL